MFNQLIELQLGAMRVPAVVAVVADTKMLEG